MEQAIIKALKGGYERDLQRNVLLDYFLDPSFWQALAKTEGWDGKCADCYRNPDGDSYVHKMCKSGSHLDMHGKYFRNKPWVDAMHRFIDHLAEGKDAESFFTDLLANKN